jgi:hypothetical protein
MNTMVNNIGFIVADCIAIWSGIISICNCRIFSTRAVSLAAWASFIWR